MKLGGGEYHRWPGGRRDPLRKNALKYSRACPESSMMDCAYVFLRRLPRALCDRCDCERPINVITADGSAGACRATVISQRVVINQSALSSYQCPNSVINEAIARDDYYRCLGGETSRVTVTRVQVLILLSATISRLTSTSILWRLCINVFWFY